MTTQLAYKSVSNPRDDHFALNPITGAVERLLLLERTHYWTLHGRDQWFVGTGGTSTAASLVSATVSSYTQTGPDGNSNAVLISSNTQTSSHGYWVLPLNGNGDFQGVPADAASRQWAFEHILKVGSLVTQVDVLCYDSAGVQQTYRFDLSTGAAVSGPDNKVRIQAVAPGSPTYAGWYRIYSVGLRFAAAPNPRTDVYMVKAGAQSFVGTAGETFYVAGYNVEFNVGRCSPQKVSIPQGWLWGKSDGEDQMFIALPTSMQTPQPLTVYMEWLDRGNAAMAGAAALPTTPGIFRIGDLANTANNYLKVTQTSTGFTGVFSNGASTSTSTVVLTVDGDNLVSLRAVINDAGALTIYASVNGAAETAGSTGTAVGFPAAWGDNFITPNSLGLTNTGDMGLRKLHVLPGAVDIAVLRGI